MPTIDQLIQLLDKATAQLTKLQGQVKELDRRVQKLESGQLPPPTPTPPPLQPDFEKLKELLVQALASRGLSGKKIVVWKQKSGKRIPVAILREGQANHRVLFPNGKDDKVLVAELEGLESEDFAGVDFL